MYPSRYFYVMCCECDENDGYRCQHRNKQQLSWSQLVTCDFLICHKHPYPHIEQFCSYKNTKEHTPYTRISNFSKTLKYLFFLTQIVFTHRIFTNNFSQSLIKEVWQKQYYVTQLNSSCHPSFARTKYHFKVRNNKGTHSLATKLLFTIKLQKHPHTHNTIELPLWPLPKYLQLLIMSLIINT